jgi:DNA-binding NarL/FixJ family response regulator
LREGLESVFRQTTDIEVVGSFSDGHSLFDALDSLGPDLVIVAAHLPDGPGAEWVRMVKRESPETKALILTFSHAEADLILSLEAGVDGYLCKECSTEELLSAMRDACMDRFHISPCVACHMRNMAVGPVGDTLTTREIEVLIALKDGLTTDEIGTRLMLSASTVKTHLGNIYRKFEVRNRVEAVKTAAERGLIGRL